MNEARSLEGKVPDSETASKKKEVPKPVDFGPNDPETRKRKAKESQERKLRSVKETLKIFVDLLKTSPDLADAAIDSTLKGIQADTGLPPEQARGLMKDALIEINENLSPKLRETALSDSLIQAIEHLTETSEVPNSDGDTKAA